MGARLRYMLDLVTNSYWFIPALITLGAIVLSIVTQAIDARIIGDQLDGSGWYRALLFAGGPDGARQVLATIAGSMITVAGVVFSITIVALTLASSQFGPRVLTNFMRDGGNKLVLGVFIATFVYSLLILRTVRGGDGAEGGSVPHLSVTIALLLALLSLSVLIYFIHHVATEIQAPNLIAGIAEELHSGVKGLVAESAHPSPGHGPAAADLLPRAFDERAGKIPAAKTGYIDAVDAEDLVEIAEERDLVLRLEHRPGHFVARGGVLARVWPPEVADDELARRVHSACVIGPRRTPIQDIEFPVNQLVEVAVRALSPGINDPFTAINCIDELSAGLAELAAQPFPPASWVSDDGKPRLIVARPVTFEGVVEAAFEQIRQNAGYHASVHIRLLEAIARVLPFLRSPERARPLLTQAELVLQAAERSVPEVIDRESVLELYRQVRAAAPPDVGAESPPHA